MPKKTSSPATKKNPSNPETPIQILREATCKSLEGSATLHYLVGIDEAGEIQFKIDKNSGGGFFSNEWISFAAIQQAFKEWPEDTPINSMALRPLFRGKSVNTPSFMLAVLTAEKLLEPMPKRKRKRKRKRVHRACDPAEFLASLGTPRQGGRVAKPKKPAAKPKAKVKAQAKPKTKPAAKAKPPRKTAAKARKKS